MKKFNLLIDDKEMEDFFNEFLDNILNETADSLFPEKDNTSNLNKNIDKKSDFSTIPDKSINIKNKNVGLNKIKKEKPRKNSTDSENNAIINKIKYQIFNIKMRLGKLSLNDSIRKFAQSLHDFDINITKNTTDKNEIKSYLSPVKGNLIALKGVLDSLETELNELEKLIEK